MSMRDKAACICGMGRHVCVDVPLESLLVGPEGEGVESIVALEPLEVLQLVSTRQPCACGCTIASIRSYTTRTHTHHISVDDQQHDSGPVAKLRQ